MLYDLVSVELSGITHPDRTLPGCKPSPSQRFQHAPAPLPKAYGHVAKYHFENLCMADSAMQKVVGTARSLAATNYTILITGERHRKELLASSIHNASARANCPFVAANFAAIPENLIESEPSAMEEGAFTGAKKHGKAGLFELAHTGTISPG